MDGQTFYRQTATAIANYLRQELNIMPCTLSHRGDDLRATRAGFDADGQPPLRAPDREPVGTTQHGGGLDRGAPADWRSTNWPRSTILEGGTGFSWIRSCRRKTAILPRSYFGTVKVVRGGVL